MIVELPIFFHSDETRQAKESGMPYHIGDCKIRKMIFYAINAINDYLDDDNKEYTEIHSNGATFISPLKVEAVAAKILQASILFLN